MLDYEDTAITPTLAGILHRSDRQSVMFHFKSISHQTVSGLGLRAEQSQDTYHITGAVDGKAIHYSSDNIAELIEGYLKLLLDTRRGDGWKHRHQ